MSKKIDREITIKPKDIPNIDSEEVGDYYNKIWRGVGSPKPKKGKGSYKRKNKHKKGGGKIDWEEKWYEKKIC